MEFQIGSAFIKVELRKSDFGGLLNACIIMPINEQLMFASRLQLSHDDAPVSTDSMVYKKGNVYFEKIAKGWIPDA